MRAACEAEKLVARLLAVLQEEEDEHDHEECRGDELDLRRDLFVLIANRWPFGNHAHLEIGAVRLFGRIGNALEHALDQRDAAGAVAEKLQLLFDLPALCRARELRRYFAELLIDPIAAEPDRRGGDAERE